MKIIPGIIASAFKGTVTDLQDSFNGTNGTNLTAHSPEIPGSGFYTVVATTGGYSINASNQAVVSGLTNGSEAYAHIDCGRSDGTLDIDITTGNTDHTVRGVLFRTVDTSNTYILELVQNTLAEKKISLTRRVGGVNGTPVDVNIPSLTGNTTYHINIVFSGTSVVVKLDGGNTLNYTAPDGSLQTATKAGLHVYYQTTNGDDASGKWDNLKISH